MQIRNYRPADLDAVIDVFQRAVHETAARDYTPEEIEAWAPETPDRAMWQKRLGSGQVWVCEEQGRIAGFTRVESDGYLDLMFVHPDIQGQGVAALLFNRILIWAKAQKIKTLFTESSRSGRGFFERCGFRVVVREQHPGRSGLSSGTQLENFVMERTV